MTRITYAESKQLDRLPIGREIQRQETQNNYPGELQDYKQRIATTYSRAIRKGRMQEKAREGFVRERSNRFERQRTSLKGKLFSGNIYDRAKLSKGYKPIPLKRAVQVESTNRGVTNNPPINPFGAPLDTTRNSMDGEYRPFTIGENGNQLNNRRTIFDNDEEFNSPKRKSIWF